MNAQTFLSLYEWNNVDEPIGEIRPKKKRSQRKVSAIEHGECRDLLYNVAIAVVRVLQ